MKNKIFSLLFALLMLFSLPLTAYAHDVPDVDKTDCSIDVILRDKTTKEGITDAQLLCIRVGCVDDDGNGNYYFYNVISGEVIENVQSPATAEALYQFAQEHMDALEKYEVDSVDADGTYHFSGLKTGLYLVVQEEAPEGYGDMNPFLVSVPYMAGGVYEYHVTAEVKTELEKTEETTEPPEPTKPSGQLPQTGQLNWPVPLLAASGLLMIAIGWMLRFHKKEEK